MNVLKQTAFLFAICLFGEILSRVLPVFIPASIIGLALLFLILILQVVRVKSLQLVSSFLLENMSLLFIPAGVSVINHFNVIKSIWIPFIIIIFVTTVLTFIVTSLAVTAAIKFLRKGADNK